MVVPKLFAVAAIIYVLFFLYIYYRHEKLRSLSLEWIERRNKPLFSLKRSGGMTRKDALPILLVTAIYAAVTFFNLGNTFSPQSFHRFEKNTPVVLELRRPEMIEEVQYFTGLFKGYNKRAYKLEFSADGKTWRSGMVQEWSKEQQKYLEIAQEGLPQDYSETFRWRSVKYLTHLMEPTQYLRLTPLYTPLEMGELSITVWNDPDNRQSGLRTLTADEIIFDAEAVKLFDEQHLVPERYDVLNSTHFDEIYHAYTAYEFIEGIYPYETTHPPLGKLITAAGIKLFGMTPFGWRFMPALFGVFMIPLLYILLKWMFGKTIVSVCGSLLFAFEFMHFVQTRISTIDVYCVFFILCMYLFMYRYISTDFNASFWKTNLPLILCGLSFGVGVAAKWQCAYAGAGLFLLFCIYQVRRADYCRRNERGFIPFFLGTAGVALASFILIPGVVYITCYIPYVMPNAPEGGFESMKEFIKALWEACKENQIKMYNYHSKLEATHNYAARWYQWLVDAKPILYYWNSVGADGTRGTLWAFTNPVTTWAGLGAIVACGFGLFLLRSHRALFILIAYLSQLVPWIPISRITFPYHYFPSMLFICVAIAYLFNRMIERSPKRGARHTIAFTAVSVFLFALFYPALSGTQVPAWYPDYLLRWLPYNWNF